MAEKGNLRFSDGKTFNTAGELRMVWHTDGWYVVGKGFLVPVNSEAEGQKMIEDMQKKKA